MHSIVIEPGDDDLFQNSSLRRLNHAHLFVIPFGEHLPVDLDAVTSGLETCRKQLIADGSIRSAAHDLGIQYLVSASEHNVDARLLHGDYYPGSFLRQPPPDGIAEDRFFVIDPEFCFIGPREFDLGVLLAHAVFCGTPADTAIHQISLNYDATASLDRQLWKGFAAVEILRRLLGVAQLPLVAELDQKKTWIELARGWISNL